GSLDETRIAEAYLDGDIDFEGSMLAALDLRGFLADRHPLASLWRFIQPWLYGEVGADKSWVPQHYDYGNEFYFAFLDRKFRLYSQAVYTSEEETLEPACAPKARLRDGGLPPPPRLARARRGRRVGLLRGLRGFARRRRDHAHHLARAVRLPLRVVCHPHPPRPPFRGVREHLRLR